MKPKSKIAMSRGTFRQDMFNLFSFMKEPIEHNSLRDFDNIDII
jgi:hypothetical protein